MINCYKATHASGRLGLDRSRHPIFQLPLSDRQVAWIQCTKWRLRYARNPEDSPYIAFQRAGAIFIHVPKTAGQSLRAGIFGPNADQLDKFPHRPAELIRRLNPGVYSQLLSFAVLRNPATRLVSTFNFLRNTSVNSDDAEFVREYLAGYKGFAEFLEGIRDTKLWLEISAWPHFRPQCEFVTDLNGNVIVDLLLCVEHLDAGVGEVSEYLGREVEVGHINASRSRGDERVPSDLLHKLYGDDLALWTSVQQAKFLWVSPRDRYIRLPRSVTERTRI